MWCDLSWREERSRNGTHHNLLRMDASQLFVVRVWIDQARFRASVRAVDSEETRVFDQPAELLQFLCGGGEAQAPRPLASP